MNETQPVSSVIRMFLLSSGQAIMGATSITKDDSYIYMNCPAEVVTKRNSHGPLGFALYPWVPNELLDSLVVRIDTRELIGEMVPSDALVKFYNVWCYEEEDKLKEFRSLFQQQINKLGEGYSKKSKPSREQQKKTQSPMDTSLSDALISLFEEDNGWGDPTVTH